MSSHDKIIFHKRFGAFHITPRKTSNWGFQVRDYEMAPKIWWPSWAYLSFTFWIIRGVIWNAPKRLWKMILSCDDICPIYLKCPKIEEFHFRFLFCFKIDHVRKIRNAPLFYVRNIWNAPFFPFSESDRKNGAFQQKKRLESLAFRKNTWSILKQKRNRKWNSSIFGHFRKKQKLSHDKIIFHMLFGARIPKVKLKIPGKLFFKVKSRTSVTFKL